MSGGHFNYKQHEVKEASDMMFDLIREQIIPKEDDYKFSKETFKRFLECYEYLKKGSVYLQRVDWLVSGDDGEESFHERLEEELKKVEKEVEKFKQNIWTN